MNDKLLKFLDEELGKAIDCEDEVELELGLCRNVFPHESTELEIKGLEYELDKWREKIKFIMKIKEVIE